MRKLKDRNSKAMSPTISTVILTGTIVALLSVAVVFVNSRLWSSVAESEFNSAKQYMQTLGLQLDDVAWTVGRKETLRYASSYGSVTIVPDALNYTVYVKTQGSGSYRYFASYTVGIVLYSIPVSKYSVTDGYYEPIFPKVATDLMFSGASAPVSRVFGVEKLTPPMSDGNFARIVVAPAIRVLSSNIETNGSIYYLKLFLPVLLKGTAHGSAQSVTTTGKSIETRTLNRVTSVNVTVTFPSATKAQGFDNSFFHFSSQFQIINIPVGYSDAILELYAGRVETVLGVQS